MSERVIFSGVDWVPRVMEPSVLLELLLEPASASSEPPSLLPGEPPGATPTTLSASCCSDISSPIFVTRSPQSRPQPPRRNKAISASVSSTVWGLLVTCRMSAECRATTRCQGCGKKRLDSLDGFNLSNLVFKIASDSTHWFTFHSTLPNDSTTITIAGPSALPTLPSSNFFGF